MLEPITDMVLYELLLWSGGTWLLGAFVGYHVGDAVAAWRRCREEDHRNIHDPRRREARGL